MNETEKLQPAPENEAAAVETQVESAPQEETQNVEIQEAPAAEEVTSPVEEEVVTEPEAVEEAAESETVEEPAEPEVVEEAAEPEAVEEPAESEAVEEPAEPEAAEETVEPETVEEPAEPEAAEEARPQYETKEQIVDRLKEIQEEGTGGDKNELDLLKQVFYKLHKASLMAARNAFIEEGHNPEDWHAEVDGAEENFKAIMANIRQRRAVIA